MNELILSKLGKQLRTFRHQKSLTLHEVALKAKVSKGLISKIENGRTIPSLPVLLSIINALSVDVSQFFNNFNSKNELEIIHKKPQDSEPIKKEEAIGFFYNYILNYNFSDLAIETVVLDLMPGSRRKPVTTDGFELKYMLEGEIDYHIGEKVIKLEKGDTLFFNANKPHVPVNNSDRKASMLIVYFLVPHQD